MDEEVCFQWRGKRIPVTHPSIDRELALLAIESEQFKTWCTRCETPRNNKRIEIHGVEIQSVDLFGRRKVGFVKIKADCSLIDGKNQHSKRLPGICFLRGNAVAILTALHCSDGETYSLLVEQPRVPIGHVSLLELPAGMVEEGQDSIAGTAAMEMEEECGLKIKPSEMIDLTVLACEEAVDAGNLPFPGLAPSPGGCDEFLRILYLEKNVTERELGRMKGRLAGLRDHGEYITLHVVRLKDVWRVSGDSNAMCGLFLLDQLRREKKVPQAGVVTTPLTPEPALLVGDVVVPQLAFGLYKIPSTPEGEEVVLQAIRAGYRHFDTASFYNNEAILGRAIKRSSIPRSDFFLCTKVWNDAQKAGRQAVRQSVESSLEQLSVDFIDLLLVHWPVPNHFVETYRELEMLHAEGKVKALGISNFSIEEYEELISAGINVAPVVNQFEVSPAMFRPKTVEYFRGKGMIVSASKALHRGASFDNAMVTKIAATHGVSPAQVFLRWGVQQGLVVVSKTGLAERMYENRDVLWFTLSEAEMKQLGSMTTEEAVITREELEQKRKQSM